MNCGFCVLLKLLELSHRKRERELLKRGSGDGYDFHRRLRKGSTEWACDGVSTEEVLAMIAEAGNPYEAKQTREGFLAMRTWLATSGEKPFRVPRGRYVSPNGVFAVSLEPEFAVQRDDGPHIYALWNTKQPELTRRAAGIAARLLERELGTGELAGAHGHVFNLRAHRPYDAVPATAEWDRKVDDEVASLERLIKRLGL